MGDRERERVCLAIAVLDDHPESLSARQIENVIAIFRAGVPHTIDVGRWTWMAESREWTLQNHGVAS